MLNHQIIRFFAILAAFCLQPELAFAACPPSGHTKAELLDLRESGFEVPDDGQRNKLAVDLLGCTGDPDPGIRDGVAYEGLSAWLRGQKLSDETLDSLYRGLLAQISDPADEFGFRQPFAALILSEVARTDRVDAYFTAERRNDLVSMAANYLSGVRDYRGYSDTEGWRHGVAHGSDLALQLVLNQNIDAGQVKRLLRAVSSQVAPPGEVFYVYGEPARLARPVIYAYQRGVLDDGFWETWFKSLVDPAPLESWQAAWSSNAGLARRHNTLSFLMAMYLNSNALPEGQGEPLAEMVMNALKQVR